MNSQDIYLIFFFFNSNSIFSLYFHCWFKEYLRSKNVFLLLILPLFIPHHVWKCYMITDLLLLLLIMDFKKNKKTKKERRVCCFFPPLLFHYKKSRKKDKKKHKIVCYERRKKIFTSVVDVAFILWLLSLYSCAPKGSSFFMTHTHTKGRLFFYFYKSRRPLLSFFYLSIHLLNFLSLSL